MTLNQFETLTEDEVTMALFIVNNINPPSSPKIEFKPRNLLWFKHDMLVKSFVQAFPRLKPEGHSIFLSLMEKMGVKGEIKQQTPPPQPLPLTSSISSSILSATQTILNQITSSSV